MKRPHLYLALAVVSGTAVFGLLVAKGQVLFAILSIVPWAAAAIPLRFGKRPAENVIPAPVATATGAAEELAAALVKLNNAVVVADETGHVLSMSALAEQLSGWSEADALGRPLSEVCPFQQGAGGDGVNVLADVAEAETTQASERATVLIRPDGATTPIRYMLSPMTGRQGRRRLFLVFRDITAQVEVETALRQSEGDFSSLIERSPDVVVVLDGSRVVYANPAFAFALGYEDQCDIVGERVDTLAAGEDRSALMRFLRAQDGREGATHRVRFRRRRSGWAVFDLVPPQATRWKGSCATLLVMRNMSERLDLEKRLSRAERLAAIGTLAAGVAHEINNPLSYMLVNLEILSDELQSQHPGISSSDGEPLETLIAETLDGAASIRQIVGDLSAYAREPTPEDSMAADVQKILRSVATLTATETRGVARLSYELGNVPAVEGNEGRLGQVLLNLILNSAYALRTREDGKNPDDNEIVLRTTQEHGGVTIEVSDNGPGVAEAELEQIFDPFFTTKPVGEGTGLGLAVCHQIVSSMGGSIDAETSPRGGLCVRVRLRIAGDAEEPRQLESADPVTAPVEKRILIADDDRRVAQSIARTLRGYRADVVTNGVDALARALDGGYDAIVCDVMMPGVNGIEVYQRLLQERPDAADHFIFLTGGVSSPEALTFREESGVRFLQKPIGRAQLLAEVESIVKDRPLAFGAEA